MLGFVDNADIDFILAGSPQGDVAKQVANQRRMPGREGLELGFDPGLMRPWIDRETGRKFCDVRTGRMVTNKGKEEPEIEPIPLTYLIQNGYCPAVYNATALPRDAWEMIDTDVIQAASLPLQAWADLRAANTFGGFDGRAVGGLTRRRVSASNEAMMDMDGLSQGRQDRRLVEEDTLPLPITHCSFEFSQREQMIARRANFPIDTGEAKEAGQRVGELVEKVCIGTEDVSSFVAGNSTDYTRRAIYGYYTQPDTITKTDLTASASFVAATFLDEVLAMLVLAWNQNIFGPFALYASTSWAQYLEDDYWVYATQGGAAPTKTVRQRVMAIGADATDPGAGGISTCKVLRQLTTTDVLLLVPLKDPCVRAINGLELTTLQWPEMGGLKTCFKVMTIQVPDLHEKFIGTSTSTKYCPIVKGTTS